MSNEKTTGELKRTSKKRAEHHDFEWEIPKFSTLSDAGNPYYSQSFSFLDISSQLRVCVPDELFDYVTVCLFKKSEYPPGVTITFSIKKYDSTLIGTKTALNEYDDANFEFLNKATLERNAVEYLPKGSLTIVCDLKFDLNGKETLLPAAEANALKENPEHMRLTELDTLSDNFKNLFVNKDSCDVVLRVEEKEFNAHKIILKARSSVFASMFNHDTLENQTGIVNIPDCDADSFHYFLEFLYSGKLESISFQNAVHLYSISDKYNIQNLKCFCVEYMKQYLTENNVCDVIILADMYEESSLLTAAQDFFNNNARKVTETTEWENLLKNNYRLANKIIKGVISNFMNVNNQPLK